MNKEKRKRIDIEVGALMAQYLELYGAANLHIEIYVQKNPARVKIKITESIEI